MKTQVITLATISALVIAIIFLILSRKTEVEIQSPDNARGQAAEARPTELSAPPQIDDERTGLRRNDAEPSRAPQAIENSTVRGTIRGVVVDQFQRPFFPSEVRLVTERVKGKGRIEPRVLQTTQGSFEFSVDLPGIYRVELSPDKLPQGVLPPWNQGQASPGTDNPDWPKGFHATTVQVPEEGGEFNVVLRVFHESVVWGRVIGPGGEGVERAHVRLQSRTFPSGLAADAHTDNAGRYEMRGVYPRKYRMQVWLAGAANSAHRDFARPVPLDVDILEGSMFEVPTIVVGTGMKSITGRVFNQDGQAFQGMTVLCYLAREVPEGEMPHNMGSTLATTRTDAQGHYQLTGLPAELVRLNPAGDYITPGQETLGKRKAAFWVEPILLDLRGSSLNYSAPDQTVTESRPFFFNGQIVFDPAWAAENKATLRSMRVTVELQDPSIKDTTVRRPSFDGKASRVDPATGEFVWACETPHASVVLTVTCSRGKAEPVRIVLQPLPFGRQEQLIRFPG